MFFIVFSFVMFVLDAICNHIAEAYSIISLVRVSHKKKYHGTSAMYHGTLPKYHGTFSYGLSCCK